MNWATGGRRRHPVARAGVAGYSRARRLDVADALRVPPVVQAAAHIGWTLAGLGLLTVWLSRRRWWPWLALAPGVPILWSTSDLNSALAAFLAIGVTVVGALAYGWRWWPAYLLLASGVALVLLLAPDSFAA